MMNIIEVDGIPCIEIENDTFATDSVIVLDFTEKQLENEKIFLQSVLLELEELWKEIKDNVNKTN